MQKRKRSNPFGCGQFTILSSFHGRRTRGNRGKCGARRSASCRGATWSCPWSFYICHMKALPMKGHGSAPVMAPEGPKIIAHGFSRGKQDDGRRGALEGRYKRLLPFPHQCRIRCRSYVGGQESNEAVSPLSGLLTVIALHPRLEAVGYDLPAPLGRNAHLTFPTS